MEEVECQSWSELESLLCELIDAAEEPQQDLLGGLSPVLFRGHADEAWALVSTLERASTHRETIDLADYYRDVRIAQVQLQSLMNRQGEEVDIQKIQHELDHLDLGHLDVLPHYGLLVHLRHHGFPSPLMDWTRSPYIAAYFACQTPSNSAARKFAIYAYQEHTGHGKSTSSAHANIHSFGPYTVSHPRHYLQQAEYTVCLEGGRDQGWQIVSHEKVFATGSKTQDRIVKFTLDRSHAPAVLEKLDRYNINDFSLFQTEDALMRTITRRRFKGQ